MTYYIDPTEEAGRKLFTSGVEGPVVMLNMLKFRETADYSQNPELAPDQPISGEEAYQLYKQLTQPFLEASGGELLFAGKALDYFIGPEGEKWDHVMLVKQASLQSFLQFATNPDYQKIVGHRTAAIVDSRLLPVIAA